MIDEFTNCAPKDEDLIVWWKNKRGSNESYVLSLTDFSYVLIVADRGDYVLPWTAYNVDYPNRYVIVNCGHTDKGLKESAMKERGSLS